MFVNQILPNQSDPFIPIIHEISADLETPVSAYLKLADAGASFLLESVSGGEQLARYSFLGVNLQHAYVLKDGKLAHHTPEGVSYLPIESNETPLDVLRKVLRQYQDGMKSLQGLPRFFGGLVGYLGYEIVRYFEPSVNLIVRNDVPESIFLVADVLIAFDHAFGKVLLIANRFFGENDDQLHQKLTDLEEKLAKPLALTISTAQPVMPSQISSNTSKSSYMEAVVRAKEHILAGDIFQVVLSQRLSRKTTAQPFAVYRALRRLNPSPYMYYFDFGKLAGESHFRIIGTSPEMHVRLENDTCFIRPIAGTRPRGMNYSEDQKLEAEMLADPKELAEHVMLVDLARNDLGRVCAYGSVKVTEFKAVERYSHVMHIVSQVEGHLAENYDAFDLIKATFPAGTVSGAPKIRAMQIINDLEGSSRGAYAGVIGYFASDGFLDSCITIRTLLMLGDEIHVQAGAGIVADSDPEREYEETMNKARALIAAVDLAEKM